MNRFLPHRLLSDIHTAEIFFSRRHLLLALSLPILLLKFENDVLQEASFRVTTDVDATFIF